ncbi:MAG: PKD domain-containing protein [Burkholderiaceae bacterium]
MWRARKFFTALGLAFSVFVSGCGGSDSNIEVAGDPAIKASVAVGIAASKTTGSTGRPITFTATAVAEGTEIAEYQWRTSTGETATGKEASFSFGTPGKKDISLRASTTAGVEASSVVSVFIFDGTDPTPAELELPDVYGDANDDGKLDLMDVLMTAQASGRMRPLASSGRRAADLDFDGKIGASDTALALDAALNNQRVASAILADFAYPGGVVTVSSPALFDPDSTVSILFGGIPGLQPTRIALGYANVVVPFNLPATGSTATVEIQVDGSTRDTLAIQIRALGSLPADSAQDVLQFLSEQRSLLQQQASAVEGQVGDSASATASARAGIVLLDRAEAELRTLFAMQGGASFAGILQRALYANGLTDFRSDLARTAPKAAGLQRTGKALTPDEICNVLIPGVCRLKATAELVDRAGSISSAACGVVSIGALIGGAALPFDGPAIEAAAAAAYVKYCVPLSIAAQVGTVMAALVSPIDLTLKSSASPNTLRGSETAEIRATVEFFGASGICSEVAAQASSALISRTLGEQITWRVMRKSVSLKLLAEAYARLGGDNFNDLLLVIQDTVSDSLSATGLMDAFSDVVGSLCSNISGGAALVPAGKVFKLPALDEGILQFKLDGTGQYSCPPPGPVFKQNVRLQGSLKLCESAPASTSVEVNCGTARVTISIGDNGSALDDIFEVVIDGRSVLTSSVPVRFTSATIDLVSGATYTVTMRGLAAPDGIGTYGIGFTGARVIGGAATSGTDLVPGVSKQFVIEVL